MENRNYDLTEQFFKVFAQLHRYYQSYDHQALNPHRGQGRVLAILNMQPEITQKELGYLLDMRNQSLGELLTKLEKAGYITRTPSQKDKRTTDIKLTEAGKAAAGETSGKTEDINAIYNCLTEEEQDNLIDYFNKITESVEKRIGETDRNHRGGFGGFFGRDGRRGPGERRPMPGDHGDRRGFPPFEGGFGGFFGRDGHEEPRGRDPYDNSHYHQNHDTPKDDRRN